MSKRIGRRRFLEIGGSAACIAGLGGVRTALADERLTGGAPHAEKLGWRLAIQAWSFNHYSLYEAIEKMNIVDLRDVALRESAVRLARIGKVQTAYDIAETIRAWSASLTMELSIDMTRRLMP